MFDKNVIRLTDFIRDYSDQEPIAYDPKLVRKHPLGSKLYFWRLKSTVYAPEVTRNEPSLADDSDWERVGGGDGGEETVFSENITVRLLAGETFGRYKNNDVIPAEGKTAAEVIALATKRVIPPTYAAPLATLSGPSRTGLEIGQTLDITLDAAFTQNDAGPVAGLSLRLGNSEISATEPFTIEDVLIEAVAKVYTAVYSYNTGVLKQDSDGANDATGRILAGTITSDPLSYAGQHKYWYGVGNANPTTGAQMRTYTGRLKTAATTFELNTGTVAKKFFIMLLPGQSIVSVLDLDAFELPIEGEYLLVDANFTGEDAAGRPIAGCKLFVKTQSVPNTANHRHQFTISNS